jgi:hypothetical protein
LEYVFPFTFRVNSGNPLSPYSALGRSQKKYRYCKRA